MKKNVLNLTMVLLASLFCNVRGYTQDGDGSSKSNSGIITYQDKQLYNIRMAGDKILDLYVDNRKIPADSFYVYNKTIEKIMAQIKKDKMMAEQDRIMSIKDRKGATKDQEQAEKDKLQAEKDQVQAEQDRVLSALDREQAEKNKVGAEKDQAEAEIDQVQAKKDEQQARIDAKHAEEDRQVMKKLIGELISQQIIPDEKSLYSLLFNDHELLVNGKPLPEEIFEKFKTKFPLHPGYGISFHDSSKEELDH